MNKIFPIFIFLYSMNAFAYYTENIPNKCGVSNYSDIYAVFTLNQYQCQSGEFLPADTLECRPCPDTYTCPGGTFVFNDKEQQGSAKSSGYITRNLNNLCSSNVKKTYTAVFTINSYTCNQGYYLPSDTDDCTICPLNNICVGGTYTFNETTDQGIEQCPNGSFAPTGSTVCYPHVLHIGNESIYLSATKRTTPSLNVAYGNEVFYANMTTTQTVMTAGSQHYLKTIYNNEIYYVCDETSCPQ